MKLMMPLLASLCFTSASLANGDYFSEVNYGPDIEDTLMVAGPSGGFCKANNRRGEKFCSGKPRSVCIANSDACDWVRWSFTDPD